MTNYLGAVVDLVVEWHECVDGWWFVGGCGSEVAMDLLGAVVRW